MIRKRLMIDVNAFLESIEGIDWYTIRVDGSATQGAPNEEVAWYKATDIYAAIEDAPTEDAEPVVHGRWVGSGQWKHKPCRMKNKEKWQTYLCSECGHSNGRRFNDKYCPNCGAKMDGGNEDGDLH